MTTSRLSVLDERHPVTLLGNALMFLGAVFLVWRLGQALGWASDGEMFVGRWSLLMGLGLVAVGFLAPVLAAPAAWTQPLVPFAEPSGFDVAASPATPPALPPRALGRQPAPRAAVRPQATTSAVAAPTPRASVSADTVTAAMGTAQDALRALRAANEAAGVAARRPPAGDVMQPFMSTIAPRTIGFNTLKGMNSLLREEIREAVFTAPDLPPAPTDERGSPDTYHRRAQGARFDLRELVDAGFFAA